SAAKQRVSSTSRKTNVIPLYIVSSLSQLQLPDYKHSPPITTPAIFSSFKLKVTDQHFNVSRDTIRKWRQRDQFEDRSHRPHHMNTSLNHIQEAIVLMLRRSLLLALDDLLVVSREFICPMLTRSSLTRLLKRHGVNSLKALSAE
ncbi:MAG: hypothetical protein CR991_04225, partial [Proteobacteria bacterium]